MRTTITIDDDVAVTLERLRRARGGKLKALVNEALREGLKHMQTPRRGKTRFRTDEVSAGPLLIPNIDSIGEALAIAEGEAYK
jgi:hypothetical protein